MYLGCSVEDLTLERLAREIDRGAGRCGHPGAAFYRGRGQVGVAELHADGLHRHTERVGSDLRHHRVGARSNVGRCRRDLEHAVCLEGRPRGGLHQQGFPHPCRNAPANELLPIAHGSRCVVAIGPSEVCRAFPVRLHQGLAGVGDVIHWIPVREVDHPELERVLAGGIGELVDRDLEQVHAGGGARCAHVPWRGYIEGSEGIAERGILAPVDLSAPLHHRLRVVLVARRSRGRVDHDGRELTVLVRRQ